MHDWRSEDQSLEVTNSMGLSDCNLKEKVEWSNGIHKETIWHQIPVTEAMTDKRFGESLKWWSEEIFFV